MSSNSESSKSHVSMCNHPPLSANIQGTVNPRNGTVFPWKSGETLFLRAGTLPGQGESVTHQFDCNTVGPVPVASGYGSSMLTHSAAYVLRDSNTHASSLQREAIAPKMDRAPVVESIDSGTQISTRRNAL